MAANSERPPSSFEARPSGRAPQDEGYARAELLPNLPQYLRRMLPQPRRWVFRRHRLAVEHDRRAHARNRAGLGGIAPRVNLHAAMVDLGILEHLIEIVDRP